MLMRICLVLSFANVIAHKLFSLLNDLFHKNKFICENPVHQSLISTKREEKFRNKNVLL